MRHQQSAPVAALDRFLCDQRVGECEIVVVGTCAALGSFAHSGIYRTVFTRRSRRYAVKAFGKSVAQATSRAEQCLPHVAPRHVPVPWAPPRAPVLRVNTVRQTDASPAGPDVRGVVDATGTTLCNTQIPLLSDTAQAYEDPTPSMCQAHSRNGRSPQQARTTAHWSTATAAVASSMPRRSTSRCTT